MDRVEEYFGISPQPLELSSSQDRKQLLSNLWVELRYPPLTPEEYSDISQSDFQQLVQVFRNRNPEEPSSSFTDKYTLAKFILEHKDEQPPFEYLLYSLKDNTLESQQQLSFLNRITQSQRNHDQSFAQAATVAERLGRNTVSGPISVVIPPEVVDDPRFTKSERKQWIIRNLLDTRLKLHPCGFIGFGRLDLFKLSKNELKQALTLFNQPTTNDEITNLKSLTDCINNHENLQWMNAYILKISRGEDVVDKFKNWLTFEVYQSLLKVSTGVEDLYKKILFRSPPSYTDKQKKCVYVDCLVLIMKESTVAKVKTFIRTQMRQSEGF